ncbi:MAG: DivIVA domain-containing protein [Candidatus Latescibacteria bacterium]|nr:DivIVA domain-containing protein [Candidatus Latescibacterota bacterium]
MRITPLDVRKQEFRKAMRGLDGDEVYAFLSTVADEYEAVLNDNKALRERLLELDDKVQEYRTIERTLRDTLLTAERVTVEAKDNARREAMLIIKEAQLEAQKALRDISTEGARLRQEVQRLRSQRDAYIAKMKVVAESHVKFIESAARDFHVEDRATSEESRAEKSYEARSVPPAPPASPTRTTGLFDASGSRPDTLPQRTSSIFEEKAPESAPTEALPGFGEILDRLSQGQRDVLESGSGVPAASDPASAPPRPAPPAQGGSIGETRESEWNMDQFRRDLQNIASTLRQSEPRE